MAGEARDAARAETQPARHSLLVELEPAIESGAGFRQKRGGIFDLAGGYPPLFLLLAGGRRHTIFDGAIPSPSTRIQTGR